MKFDLFPVTGRCRAPSQEGLRSPGRKVNSESLCAPGGQPEKEREGERKKDTGTRVLMEQRCFNMVWAYILSYKIVILSKDKD